VAPTADAKGKLTLSNFRSGDELMTAHEAEPDSGRMAGDRLRAADEDRQWVAERLRAALDQGRLRLAEYDERLALAYQAQTYAELNLLLDDLPPAIIGGGVAVPAAQQPVPAATPARPARAAEPAVRGLPMALIVLWIIYGAAVGINVVVWLLVMVTSGEWIYPWPIWVAGPAGIAMLSVTAGVQQIRRNRRG
jgi:hypothetical protein